MICHLESALDYTWDLYWRIIHFILLHYSDVIMSPMAFQITHFPIVCSAVCSSADQRKHQSSAPLAFVRGIHWWPVDSPHKSQKHGKYLHLMASSCREIHVLDLPLSVRVVLLTLGNCTSSPEILVAILKDIHKNICKYVLDMWNCCIFQGKSNHF